MRRLTAVLLLVFLVPAAARAAGTVTPQQQVKSIEAITVKLRGLPAAHVSVAFPSNAAFDADFNALQHGLTPEAEVQMDARESRLLGLLTSKDNLKKILFSSASGQFVGFYDDAKKTLYVRSNLVFGPDRWVIAHEYTHALQDKAYDLGQLLPDQFPLAYRNSDMVAAHHALTEGDAVNVEGLFIRQTYSRKDLKALIQEESKPATGPKLPATIQREINFPYTTGVNFVTKLYSHGGMAAVDAAYKRLPSSTYEIMHPSAYLAHWRPIDVALHGVQGFTSWQQIDDDVFGAFGYHLVLWQWLGSRKANAITDGYRGDRYLFLENGKQNAMLLVSIWNGHAAAVAARDAWLAALEARFRHSRIRTSPHTVLVNPGTAVDLEINGSTLTLAYAPTPALATQLATAPRT